MNIKIENNFVMTSNVFSKTADCTTNLKLCTISVPANCKNT